MTYEGQFAQAKKLIFVLLKSESNTVQKIKEYLHSDALMSLDHSRVEEIFLAVTKEMLQIGRLEADRTPLSDTTRVWLSKRA